MATEFWRIHFADGHIAFCSIDAVTISMEHGTECFVKAGEDYPRKVLDATLVTRDIMMATVRKWVAEQK